MTYGLAIVPAVVPKTAQARQLGHSRRAPKGRATELAAGNRFSNRNHRRKRLGVNELQSALSAVVTPGTVRSVEFRLADAGSLGSFL